jgi:hypothetical protein
MSGHDTLQAKLRRALMELPGKRGLDIPAETYDRIFDVASGITMPVWGRPPTPEQMDFLYRNGHHTPDRIHAAFSQLPHPHAPTVRLGEYQTFQHALETYQEHGGKM